MIKIHETLTENLPVQIYPNKIKKGSFLKYTQDINRIIIFRNNETIR